MMRKENWIWMPHAGHFIQSNLCQFRLNTYVGGYIVSTVGELKTDYKNQSGNYEEITIGRKYETMVFRATKGESECCPYVIEVENQVDFRSYNDPVKATEGHYELCVIWSKKEKGGA